MHLRAHGIPVADFEACADAAGVRAAGEKFGYPLMLKSRTMAYDGRGNAVVRSEAEVESAIASLVSQVCVHQCGGCWGFCVLYVLLFSMYVLKLGFSVVCLLFCM